MALGRRIKSDGRPCDECGSKSTEIREKTEDSITVRYRRCSYCGADLGTVSDNRRDRHAYKEHERISGNF